MRRIIIVLTILLFTGLTLAQQSVGPAKVIYPTKMMASQPLRDLARPIPEPVVQSGHVEQPFGATVVTWGGLSVHENPSHVEPGNPTIAVGPNNDLVQMVNNVFYMADKNNTWKVPPALNTDLWIGFGGVCEFNDGYPIVLYDPLADRWLMSQHVFSQKQCIAISQTSDPTGAYFLYEFDTPGNDSPRMGVWSDGYYVGMKNLTAGEYDVYVFEKDKMLAGNPNPRGVSFDLETLLPGADNFLPADVDGMTPPPVGSPGIFLGMHDPSILQSHLDMFELSVDWNNTTNSTLTGPIAITVSSFDGSLCNFNPDCIRQPNTSQRLDALSGTMMQRVAYRNFGTHQSIVANHTVDFGDFPNHAAIRWYEFRSFGSGWLVHQEGTYAPDTDSRWNGSIAMNGAGDIMMGYTVSSVVTVPSIRYVGRQAGDPLGEMTLIEGNLIQSLSGQVGTNLWGKYSMTVVDPADDFSFWHTNYWVEGPSDDWHTWIGRFQPTTDAPDIVITMVPHNPPISIPAGGGSFTYDLMITNISDAITFDVWNIIDRPGGGTAGPTIGPLRVTFTAGEVFTKTIVQNVPAAVPIGTYTFNFNAGRYASNPVSQNIIATDNFLFTKSASPEKIGADSEVVTNWDSKFYETAVHSDATPKTSVLEQNYPNPFNPSTVIRYSLSRDSHVKLTIYNTLGQEVARLVDEFQEPGFKSVTWNGRTQLGQQVSAGIYLYKLEAENAVQTRRMVFSK